MKIDVSLTFFEYFPQDKVQQFMDIGYRKCYNEIPRSEITIKEII